MPPIVTTSPSRRRSSSAIVASDLRRSWSRMPDSGMLRDVEAEHLLLEPQQLVLLVLVGWRRRMVLRLLVLRWAEVEDRPLPREPVGLLLLPPPDGLLEHLEVALARAGQRTALDESLQHALVRHDRIDALGKVPDRLERAALGAGRDQRPCRTLPHALHGVEAEADLALDDREVDLRLVHVGRQHLDAELVARVDVDRHAVLRRHHRADQRRHVLARMVLPQPCGLVGDQRVAGRMRLRERVVGRLLDILPQLLRDTGSDAVLRGAVQELVLQ